MYFGNERIHQGRAQVDNTIALGLRNVELAFLHQLLPYSCIHSIAPRDVRHFVRWRKPITQNVSLWTDEQFKVFLLGENIGKGLRNLQTTTLRELEVW